MSLRKIVGIVLAIVVCAVSVVELKAQSPFTQRRRNVVPPRRPVISPYLHLLRPDGSTAENYWNLVRPQQEFRRNINQNQQSINDVRRDTQILREQQTGLIVRRQAAGSTLSSTGHSARFRYPGSRLGR